MIRTLYEHPFNKTIYPGDMVTLTYTEHGGVSTFSERVIEHLVTEEMTCNHVAIVELTEVADSEFADSKAGKTLIEKLKAASFVDLVATVEVTGF